MPDAGNAGPVPTTRRYGMTDVVAAYDNLFKWADTADRLGYDTMWLTEHHFQHEGYEVIPNIIQFGMALALRTERLRQGQMFNVVPQWHPLRLAEDFALADVLTGGRMVFGVGRGTVPREAESLGSMVASGDNEMSREADRINREHFEEAMEVIKLAWTQERFSYTGKHYSFPPVGIPDRGSLVTELTLVPRPTREIEIYQPITSPDTMTYAPAVGHKGIYWQQPPSTLKRKWDDYAEVAAAAGRTVAPGRGSRAGVERPRRRDSREGDGSGAERARRVLPVPRPVRAVPQLPPPGRHEPSVRLPARARRLDGATHRRGRHAR